MDPPFLPLCLAVAHSVPFYCPSACFILCRILSSLSLQCCLLNSAAVLLMRLLSFFFSFFLQVVRVLMQLYESLGDRIALQYGGSQAHKKVGSQPVQDTQAQKIVQTGKKERESSAAAVAPNPLPWLHFSVSVNPRRWSRGRRGVPHGCSFYLFLCVRPCLFFCR